MNLVYSCVFFNEKYIILIEKLLSSFYKHNKNNNICYLIITTSKFEEKIRNICKNIGLSFDIWTRDICNSDKSIDNIYEATYSRYAIYQYPNINNYNKILYLDTDILVINNLNPLFDLELSNLLYTLYEDSYNTRLVHCALFDEKEFTIAKKNKDTFTTAIILFINNTIMLDIIKNIYQSIEHHHKISNGPLPCYDQPIVNKLAYSNKIVNNKLLNNYCINIAPTDGVNKLSEMSKYLICHFATDVGDANSKIKRMSVAETIL